MRDRDDITQAVATHSNTVLRACSLYFGIRTEREDAFQETFLKYAQSPKVFVDDEHRKAWLIRVAINVCKDMLKQAETRAVLTDEVDEAARPSWQPEDNAASGRVEELAEALQKLDARYRDVLYLKYYECYTASEIANILNIPENTVYTNLARGRERLKEVLARER